MRSGRRRVLAIVLAGSAAVLVAAGLYRSSSPALDATLARSSAPSSEPNAAPVGPARMTAPDPAPVESEPVERDSAEERPPVVQERAPAANRPLPPPPVATPPSEPEAANLPERSVLHEDGLVVHHENGALAEVGGWRDGRRQGHWSYWEEDGSRIMEGTYTDGLAQGRWLAWHDSGGLRADAGVLDGKFHGYCVFYDRDGTVDAERSGTYEHGERIGE